MYRRLPKFIGSQSDWQERAEEAQDRADDRREIEWERDQRILPYRGFLEWVGLFVVLGMCLFAILCVLWLAGVLHYDPAFSGRN